MRSSCCLCVCKSPTVNFRMHNAVFKKLDMVHEPISTEYVINPSPINPYVYICMTLPLVGN
jgi:hypothetical protein